MNLLEIIVALAVVYGLYKLIYKRENFDGIPLYATLGTFGSLLVVGLVGYLVYNILSVKKLMSLQLVR